MKKTKEISGIKGITLIALIITIIVLLILAGVVINLTMGDNGIIGKVQTAVGKYENAQDKENSALAQYEKEIDILSNRNTENLERVKRDYIKPDGEKEISINSNGTIIENVKEFESVKINVDVNTDLVYEYPIQKFSVTKDINGYVYTLKVYNISNQLIYSTTYNCDIWGVFSSEKKTYEFEGKTYTITASGVNSTHNFRGILSCEGLNIYNINGYVTQGDNGSWPTNTTSTMPYLIKYNSKVYCKT